MLAAPTKTYLKLRDAAAQMKLAVANARDEEMHRSCINAFISAARSVTLVMQKESANVRGLTEWYGARRDALSSDPLLRFFNERRVHSIHKGVVEPTKGIVTFRGKVTRIATIDEHGREVDVRFSGVFGPEASAIRPGDVLFGVGPAAIFWTFEGVEEYLPGHSGNVERLCEDYFVKLKAFVQEWEAKRAALSAPKSS
jgi:hypothetical protein